MVRNDDNSNSKIIQREVKLNKDLNFALNFKSLQETGFLLQGGRGRSPKTTFPPKRRLPLKTIERTIETIAYRFKNNGLLSFAPLKFFSNRKPGESDKFQGEVDTKRK